MVRSDWDKNRLLSLFAYLDFISIHGNVVVADSTLASKASTGVLVQRENKDFHCFAVLEHSSSTPNGILFFFII